MNQIDAMTPRDLAARAARIAIYGSADVRTPADWTWLECLQAARKEKAIKQRKGKQDVEVDESVLGPIFKSEGGNE